MTIYCVVCARSFEDTGKIISGNAVRLAIVETFLLPYRLIKRCIRDRKNKILAKRMGHEVAKAPGLRAVHNICALEYLYGSKAKCSVKKLFTLL